jgi:protein-S-isoprenylcysteine O-methyltransferase Ste14
MKWKWGNVPVPVQYLVGLVLGGILQALFPWLMFSKAQAADMIGVIFVAFGVAIVISSVVAAGKVDIESPQSLITAGPYGRSRNPMMVAWTIIYLGIAFILNSVWAVAFLLLGVLFTHFVDIPREERLLSEQFGDEYLEYRRKVRRYI